MAFGRQPDRHGLGLQQPIRVYFGDPGKDINDRQLKAQGLFDPQGICRKLGLGLLLCQRALTCALLGAVAAGRGHLERALARLEPLRLAPDSEASRTLEAARERLGV